MRLRQLMNEGGGAPEGAKPETPQYLTAEQVGQIIQKNNEQLIGKFTELVTGLQKPDPPARETKPEEKPDFYTKPEQAAARMIDEKLKPLVDLNVANESDRQLREVATLPEADLYQKEIEAQYRSLPPVIQMQPGMARQVYDLVMGRHFDEVAAKRAERKEKAQRQPEFTETRSSGQPPAPKGSDLSTEERKAMEASGISPEEWKQWRDNREAMAEKALAGKKA